MNQMVHLPGVPRKLNISGDSLANSLHELTPGHIERLVQAKSKTLASQTVNHIRKHFLVAFNCARRAGEFVGMNPAQDVRATCRGACTTIFALEAANASCECSKRRDEASSRGGGESERRRWCSRSHHRAGSRWQMESASAVRAGRRCVLGGRAKAVTIRDAAQCARRRAQRQRRTRRRSGHPRASRTKRD